MVDSRKLSSTFLASLLVVIVPSSCSLFGGVNFSCRRSWYFDCLCRNLSSFFLQIFLWHKVFWSSFFQRFCIGRSYFNRSRLTINVQRKRLFGCYSFLVQLLSVSFRGSEKDPWWFWKSHILVGDFFVWWNVFYKTHNVSRKLPLVLAQGAGANFTMACIFQHLEPVRVKTSRDLAVFKYYVEHFNRKMHNLFRRGPNLQSSRFVMPRPIFAGTRLLPLISSEGSLWGLKIFWQALKYSMYASLKFAVINFETVASYLIYIIGKLTTSLQ